jgi:chorismate dehydratase
VIPAFFYSLQLLAKGEFCLDMDRFLDIGCAHVYCHNGTFTMIRPATLSIGHIDYANCTPIFTTLTSRFDCRNYRFVRGVPAELNAMLRRAEIDVCPSSSIEYAKSPESYYLLPELSISAIGKVRSVLLFSQVPIEDLDGREVGLTVESDTSVNLLKIVLAKSYGFTNEFHATSLPLDAALNSFPALLLIGDKALQAARTGAARFVYDLGELWHKFTGLPFVFALWLVNRQVAATRHAELRILADQLLAAKHLAYQTYGEIASSCAEQNWMTRDDLVDYWRTISYDLGQEHLLGVTTFFRHACDLGLITMEPEIKVFS